MKCLETRMITFIKTKFKILDDQTNIDRYRLAAKITVYHILSKLILQQIIITLLLLWFSESWESDLESPYNFQEKEKKKIFTSVHKQEIDLLWSSEAFVV